MGRSRPEPVIAMSVASILRAKGAHVEGTRPDTTLYRVVWDLKVRGIGAPVVSEDGSTVLGIISERDIVRGLTERGTTLLTLPVSELMTSPPVTCAPGESITARHLPVVEGGKLCGIVSTGDVVKHRLDELELEAKSSAKTRWPATRSAYR